jgi:hypothetical protein
MTFIRVLPGERACALRSCAPVEFGYDHGMPLGPHVPAWQALRDELQKLVDETEALFAMVTDESNVVWCWSKVESGHYLWRESPEEVGAAVASLASIFHVEQVAPLSHPLRRGGHLHVVHSDRHWRTARSYQALSFAGIYIGLVQRATAR